MTQPVLNFNTLMGEFWDNVFCVNFNSFIVLMILTVNASERLSQRCVNMFII